jgi:hypothetical protein
MKMRKLLILPAVFFCMKCAFAQKQMMVLEKLRCLSTSGPTMLYLKDAGIKKTIASQLSQVLVQLGYPALTDTNTIANLEFPARMVDLNRNDLAFSGSDTAILHLYLDFYETSAYNYFAPAGTTAAPVSGGNNFFMLRASIFKYDKSQVFREEMNIRVLPGESMGMGVPYNGRMGQLAVTQRGFTELFRSATKILLDPENAMTLIQLKALPVFMGDDYILPKISGKTRTLVTTSKNISRYFYNEQPEMIRLGDAVYEEIILKGKKAQKYPADITAMIKSRANYGNSDFIFLRQECRDVLRDKNYLIKLCAQIDPQNMREGPYMFTNFLPLDFHYLFLENDTIAKFTIEGEVTDEKNKLYPETVSNGIDSSSFFTISTLFKPYFVRYDYIVKGTIGKKKFAIKCSGNRNHVKEIYLDDELVCIAQGKFSPEKFVVFNASLSPEIMNPLLMIGFNRFLE